MAFVIPGLELSLVGRSAAKGVRGMGSLIRIGPRHNAVQGLSEALLGRALSIGSAKDVAATSRPSMPSHEGLGVVLGGAGERVTLSRPRGIVSSEAVGCLC